MREFKIPPRPRDGCIREALLALEDSKSTTPETTAAAQVFRDLWRHLQATERQMAEITRAFRAVTARGRR